MRECIDCYPQSKSTFRNWSSCEDKNDSFEEYCGSSGTEFFWATTHVMTSEGFTRTIIQMLGNEASWLLGSSDLATGNR